MTAQSGGHRFLNYGVLSRYADLLPLTDKTPIISLGEGDTPLIRAFALQKHVGCAELHLKLEGCNPTGSFKDRGMVVAVAKALEGGAHSVICASTGNTAASAAAYAAAASLSSIVVLPKGKIALGKMAQCLIAGARILAVEGNFDQALEIVRGLADRHPVAVVNSINPHRLEGQKTAAFEICDALGDAPEVLCIPVGNAGNISAYWKGFAEYREIGHSASLPRIWGFQAEGAAPIVLNRVVENPQTIATAIRIGNPASWPLAITARDESEGLIEAVSDAEILSAHRLLAGEQGIFVEPASAASIAGMLKVARSGRYDLSRARVVCVLTGTGLKDPDTAASYGGSTITVQPTVEDAERALGW